MKFIKKRKHKYDVTKSWKVVDNWNRLVGEIEWDPKGYRFLPLTGSCWNEEQLITISKFLKFNTQEGKDACLTHLLEAILGEKEK